MGVANANRDAEVVVAAVGPASCENVTLLYDGVMQLTAVAALLYVRNLGGG